MALAQGRIFCRAESAADGLGVCNPKLPPFYIALSVLARTEYGGGHVPVRAVLTRTSWLATYVCACLCRWQRVYVPVYDPSRDVVGRNLVSSVRGEHSPWQRVYELLQYCVHVCTIDVAYY